MIIGVIIGVNEKQLPFTEYLLSKYVKLFNMLFHLILTRTLGNTGNICSNDTTQKQVEDRSVYQIVSSSP